MYLPHIFTYTYLYLFMHTCKQRLSKRMRKSAYLLVFKVCADQGRDHSDVVQDGTLKLERGRWIQYQCCLPALNEEGHGEDNLRPTKWERSEQPGAGRVTDLRTHLILDKLQVFTAPSSWQPFTGFLQTGLPFPP